MGCGCRGHDATYKCEVAPWGEVLDARDFLSHFAQMPMAIAYLTQGKVGVKAGAAAPRTIESA